MLSRFGIEASQAAQYVIAFVIILVLVALFGLVLRRLTGGRLMLPGQDRGRARQPRLGIVDIYDLDRQRQLILLRRDNVEHLLLIGGPNDVVIETNIVRVAGARLPAAGEPSLDRPEAALDRGPEFPARPQVENGRPSLEAQIAARLNDLVARPSDQSDADQELSAVGTATASVPLRVEPPLKPDSVSGPSGAAQGLGAAPGPVPGAGFRPSRTEPTMPEPPRPPAAEPPPVRAEPRPTPSLRPVPPPPRPVTTPEPVRPAPARPMPPQPPVPAPAAETRAPEAAILSDMAKQLEQALRRPGQAPGEPAGAPQRGPVEQPPGERGERPIAASGPQSTSAQTAPQGPARPPEPPRPAVEPVRPVPLRPDAARIPAEPARPEPARPEANRPEAVRPEAIRPEQGRPEPVRPEPPRPEPIRPEPARPEPVRPEPPRQEAPRAEPARPEPARAEPPRPAAAAAAAEPPAASPKRTVDDPFSVEEIEAEFARLLGRPVDKSDRG